MTSKVESTSKLESMSASALQSKYTFGIGIMKQAEQIDTMLEKEFAKCETKLHEAEPKAKLAEPGSKVANEFKDLQRQHEIASEAIKMSRQMRQGAEKELSEIKARIAKIAPNAISL